MNQEKALQITINYLNLSEDHYSEFTYYNNVSDYPDPLLADLHLRKACLFRRHFERCCAIYGTL